MGCVLCHIDEMALHEGKKVPFNHGSNVTSFLCSNCTAMLLQTPQEKVRAAYDMAVEKGQQDKADMLLSFIDEKMEDFNGSETRKFESNMVRERPLQQARPSRNEKR